MLLGDSEVAGVLPPAPRPLNVDLERESSDAREEVSASAEVGRESVCDRERRLRERCRPELEVDEVAVLPGERRMLWGWG